MNFEKLPDSIKDEIRECTSSDELLDLAAREGVELTDEQVEAISGGAARDWMPGAFYY